MERLVASWPIAIVAALLAGQGAAAPFAEPSRGLALTVSGAAVVIAGALGVARLRQPAPTSRGVVLAAAVVAGLAGGLATGAWAALLAASLAAAAASLVVFEALPPRLPDSLEGASARHPRLRWLWLAVALASVVTHARFAAFMQDVDFRAGAVLPTTPPKHMCLPAYLRGAELAETEPQAVYDTTRYEKTETSIAGMERWLRDPYMYPPPGLVPARLALALSRDFAAIRTVWFALQGLFFLAVSLALLRGLAPASAALYAWLWPALAMAWPVLYNFEYGQAHLFTLALSVGGMLALAARRRLLGGALLGGAIALKIFPGLLVLYLLIRRRWLDAVAATAGTLAWLAIAVPIAGTEVYASFLFEHLPRLASGEAFATFIEHVEFDAPHLSPHALVFTLRGLGLPGMGWTTARALSAVYTLIVLGAAVVAARRPDQPLVWLSLLALGASRSPYAPAAYVMAGAIWLVVVLAAELAHRPRLAWGILTLGAFLQTAPFLGSLPPFWSWPILAGIATPIMTLLVIALSLWSLSRTPYGVA